MMVEKETTAPIAVFGIGNVLMGDDALGPTVIAGLLAGFEFPAEVHVEDLGTPGLDLHPHLAGRRHIILVDVIKATGKPGEIKRYTQEDLLRHLPKARTNPHDPGVKEALLSLQFADDSPDEVILVGVIPDKVEHAAVMTPIVRAAVPGAEAAVLEELRKLDVHPVARDPRPAPDLWWEEKEPGDG